MIPISCARPLRDSIAIGPGFRGRRGSRRLARRGRRLPGRWPFAPSAPARSPARRPGPFGGASAEARNAALLSPRFCSESPLVGTEIDPASAALHEPPPGSKPTPAPTQHRPWRGTPGFPGLASPVPRASGVRPCSQASLPDSSRGLDITFGSQISPSSVSYGSFRPNPQNSLNLQRLVEWCHGWRWNFAGPWPRIRAW